MKKKILYLECGSGISGDMTVAALLDLGADREAMERAVASLPVAGFRTEIRRVVKSGLDACDFAVILDEAHENHDHDMEYLHGPGAGHSHEHTHADGTAHSHEHTHGEGTPHTHEHRTLPEILHILSRADMTDSARTLAGKIFGILADAEAEAHGIPREQVHFHEVGAVDSIVDITAAAVLLDSLQADEVVIPELAEGQGFVRCQHGVIPVPVPAVLNIARAYGLVLQPTGISGELVTPTGAAIAAAIRTADRLPRRMKILRSGLGAGKRTYERPGLLRAMLVEPAEEETLSLRQSRETEDCILKLEANMDDCTGENLGYVLELLFAAGARDVHYSPVFMKKNRPGYQLNVICDPADRERMEEIIFRETTTIGIRCLRMERAVMERQFTEVKTPHGTLRMKVCRRGDVNKVYPEYEDVKRICRETGLSFTRVCEEAMAAYTR